MDLRLCLIQPEIMYPLIIVILLNLIPYKRPCLRISHINKGLLAVEIKGSVLAALGTHQHVPVIHLAVILTCRIYGGPD